MNQRELRIGNLICIGKKEDGTDKIGIVVSLAFIPLEARHETDFWETDEYYPIPLTEEWLLRFGFEKSISFDGESIMQLPSTNFYLEHIIFPGDTLKDCYYFNCESVKSGHRLCGHVHQLQNLYFALTGHELILDAKSETA